MIQAFARTSRIRKHVTGTTCWIALALAITAANLANEASVEFSFLSGLFIILTYLTVSNLGGLKSIFGAVVGYLALQHVIVACFSKFLLGEPIEQRLNMPAMTMGIYCVGMASMWTAALALKGFNPTRGKAVFLPIVDAANLRRMALIGLPMELAQIAASRIHLASLASQTSASGGGGGLVTVVQAMGFIVPMTVGSATAAVVLRSGGRRSFDVLVFIAILFPMLGGLLGAGRIDSTIAIVSYYVVALLFGFRFRIVHGLILAAMAIFAVYVVFPYSLVARKLVRGPDVAANIQKAVEVFGQIALDPERFQTSDYQDERKIPIEKKRTRFFDPPRNVLERFSLIKSTDEIGRGSLRYAPLGWETVTDGLTMTVPSFLNPDKPSFGDNNMLGRLAPGMVGPRDFVTQPNTGIMVDAFASFRWAGVAIVPFVLLFLYVFLFRMIAVTDLTSNVFGASIAITVAHTFSEQGVSAQVVEIIQSPFLVLFGFAMFRAGAHLFDLKGSRKTRRTRVAPSIDPSATPALEPRA